jgi:hypothetical protein
MRYAILRSVGFFPTTARGFSVHVVYVVRSDTINVGVKLLPQALMLFLASFLRFEFSYPSTVAF